MAREFQLLIDPLAAADLAVDLHQILHHQHLAGKQPEPLELRFGKTAAGAPPVGGRADHADQHAVPQQRNRHHTAECGIFRIFDETGVRRRIRHQFGLPGHHDPAQKSLPGSDPLPPQSLEQMVMLGKKHLVGTVHQRISAAHSDGPEFVARHLVDRDGFGVGLLRHMAGRRMHCTRDTLLRLQAGREPVQEAADFTPPFVSMIQQPRQLGGTAPEMHRRNRHRQQQNHQNDYDPSHFFPCFQIRPGALSPSAGTDSFKPFYFPAWYSCSDFTTGSP